VTEVGETLLTFGFFVLLALLDYALKAIRLLDKLPDYSFNYQKGYYTVN
jgi:hypothetical protein